MIFSIKQSVRLKPVVNLVAVFASAIIVQSITAQNIPSIYIKLYDQMFNADTSLKHIEFTDPSEWKLVSEPGNRVMDFKNSQVVDSTIISLPYSIALISDQKYGDFIMEAQFKQPNLNKDSEPVDFCIFIGARSASNYYCIRLSNDSSLSKIYKFNGTEWISVSGDKPAKMNLVHGKWHKVRVERDIVQGVSKVYLDKSTVPVLQSSDKSYRMGAIGFGTFSNNVRIDNIKIWGPTVVTEKTGYYQGK